jgi:dihydrofolate reductase
MRELVLKMHLSLDGFVGAPDGDVAWIDAHFDDALTDWEVAGLWNTDLHIMGARTFRDMAAHWPTSTEAFAAPMNAIAKMAFSRAAPAHAGVTLSPDWAATPMASDLAGEITRLKKMQGKPILAHGGAGFARSLIATGLIDAYHLVTHPVALGRGLAIFSELTGPLTLKLISAQTFPAGANARIYRT